MPDWQELMNRDGKAVWQTAYRLLGNRADADECFQEACSRVLCQGAGSEHNRLDRSSEEASARD